MLHRHSAGDSLVRLQSHHACQEIQAVLIQILRMLRQRNALPFWERGLEVWQLESSGPVGFTGSTLNLEDLEYLIDF